MNPGIEFGTGSVNPPQRASGIFNRLRLENDGVSAVEFAMILPFMFFLLIGMTTVAEYLNQDRKVSRIANTVADLIAQEEAVSGTDLDDLLEIGEEMLNPYSTTDLQVIVASVTFDEDGDASVDWSRDTTSGEPWAPGSLPPITLPETVAIPNSSIVVGQANLLYTPSFTGVFAGIFEWSPSVLNLSDTYYLSPRITGTVTCDTC